VDFSEARDLFVIIFRILDRTGKIRDRGLISKKHRGLSAKSAKTRPRVDFKETQGLLCKIPGNIDLTNYFPMVKVVDRVHAPVDWFCAQGRRSGRSPVNLPRDGDRG
jgi:hypothetical protein